MNIAVVKIGFVVSEKSQNIPVGEVKSIVRTLKKSDYVDKVTIFSLIKNEDESDSLFNCEKEFDIKDLVKDKNEAKNYDVLVVINGTTKFVYLGPDGGDSGTVETYEFIHDFNGRIFYFLCDPMLPFTQLNLENKEWAQKYKDKDYLKINKPITYITQAFNLDLIEKDVKKLYPNVDQVKHFSFEKFPFMYKRLDINPEYSVDLSYGGTFRSGRREDDMIKYYFGHDDDISVEMFGKLSLDKFNQEKIQGLRAPSFGQHIDYSVFDKKMNKALSTVIIGDHYYIETEDIAQRVYESINASVVTFIDIRYDKNQRIYSNELLRDFCYVSSVNEIDKKIRLLKKDFDFRKKIIDLQYNDTVIDFTKYSNELIHLMRSCS